jgi:hypothetical protein
MRISFETGLSFRNRAASWIVPAALTFLVAGSTEPVRAQQPDQVTFASPADASRALVQAVQSEDNHQLAGMLGGGPEVTSSGDASADSLEREQFVRKYQQMHRLVREPNGMIVLYVGAENWPFPIPLASRDGRWFFDAKTGAEEILVRRIGEHEANATDACRSLISMSDASPAVATDLNNETANGYRFRAVDPQPEQTSGSSSGRGGSQAKMISGVRFVAFPVQYRSSGVMTFIVTASGAVYQRDLGPETSVRAAGIKGRVPSAGWVLVQQ